MRVSFKWLKELVDISVSPEQLADKMTLSGVAVENIEYMGEGIDKVVTGRLEKIAKHPDADKLVICQVNVGTAETIQIVTGASNVKEGQVVPVAVVGATLPGMKMKKAKLRGVESSGMLCSGKELGLDEKNLADESKNGILILSADTPLGMDIKEVLALDDVILELELTPNRADCLSMVGVAREVAAVLGTKLHLPELKVSAGIEQIAGQVTIKIDDPDLCNRYVGRMVKNIKIAPSPQWMQQRLQAAGVRPINNIVDVTNYVMMELGQPLHAFDFSQIAQNTILVRRAKAGEHIITLDDADRELTAEMLVITDPDKAVAVAGVMGGQNSEITATTKTILIESAHFNGASIRRTSKALGLRSEASSRFEKGINKDACQLVADRAVQLIQEMGAGEIVAGYAESYPVPYEKTVVKLRPARVEQVLGLAVPKQTISQILDNLRFNYKTDPKEKAFIVDIPSARSDITMEVDLIEEVARLNGYDKIPTTLPAGATTQGQLSAEQKFANVVKDALTNCGLFEVVSMSFTNPRVLDLIKAPENSSLREVVTVQNPLSEEQRILRTTLVPALLDIISRNVARKNLNVGIFETGMVFHPLKEEQLPLEKPVIAMAITGQTAGNWQHKAGKVDFYYMKGIVEILLDQMGINDYRFVPESNEPSFHPGATARIEVDGLPVGILGEIHPDVQENYDLPDRVYLCQLDASMLQQKSNFIKKYSSLPKYPAIERDMAFVAKAEVSAAEITDIISKAGGRLLKEVRLFDVYQGKQIEAGYKSVAFSLLYQAEDRTLTDEEVNKLHDKIEKELAEKVGAELRG